MKLKYTFNKFIYSKLLLYAVFILSTLVFLGNLLTGHFDVVVYFVFIAGMTSFFTNNMTIVLFIPLFSVYLYSHIIKPHFLKRKEGMENSEDSDKSEQEKIDELKKNTSTNSGSTSNNSLPIVPVNDNSSSNEETSSSNEENFKNNDSKKSDSNKKKKYNIDYASTVEEAYDNLNNIIGSDGIQNLTGDTKRLMDQQLKLTEAMKNIQPLVETMGPLLEKAGGLLNSMGGSENIGNLASFAKNFSSSNK
jgi:hypothetical protein